MEQGTKHGTLFYNDGKGMWKLLGAVKSQRIGIGKNPINHIVLEVPHADIIHCEITLKDNVAMIRNFSYPNPIRVNGLKVYHETQLRSKDTIQVAGFILLWYHVNSLDEWWRLMQFGDDNRPTQNIVRAFLTLNTDRNAKLRFFGCDMPPAQILPDGTLCKQEKMMSVQALKLQKEINHAVIISNFYNVDMEELVGM
ncbi:uncharacterized protein LOC121603527 [Anopheles merus]|uniref:uncharacterized protein LOC121603527 n=1 Tax=Anopheles merus TaxID=30066 RepID=UPI001BE4385F|nr:uncharacterized protein LOC121603527 [Anopheles merus]